MFINKAFSLIEILLSLSIISIALLGLMQLQAFTLFYQYESTLLAKSANIISNVMLANSYQDTQVDYQQSIYAQRALPQGQLSISKTPTQISMTLHWKLPKLSAFQLTFTVI
ncbi:MAG: hypothetical protein CMF49_00895 [Legionellales bacterium]|nr:hypothetical protein [Legionellales bacterium]|tara:strand:- start:64 stop:399 length:336 start_codon:yes stop_codon:yes gene_type:complete